MHVNEMTCQKPWHGLFEQLLCGRGQRSSDRDSTEFRLPAHEYTDSKRYEAEVATLFRQLPLCLGHEDQLRASGSTLAREVAGLPLLLTRDSTGVIRVFINACRHCGARLMTSEEAVCHRSSLSCLPVPWLDIRPGWTAGQRATAQSLSHAGRCGIRASTASIRCAPRVDLGCARSARHGIARCGSASWPTGRGPYGTGNGTTPVLPPERCATQSKLETHHRCLH